MLLFCVGIVHTNLYNCISRFPDRILYLELFNIASHEVRKGIRSENSAPILFIYTPRKECYEGEVQPYWKTDYKPIIYIYICVCGMFFCILCVSVCILTVSNALPMSSATVIVQSGDLFLLKPVAMVLFMLCSAVLKDWLLLKPCCVEMLFVMYGSSVFYSVLLSLREVRWICMMCLCSCLCMVLELA